MALDAVIFDIDGTLLDTNQAHVEAWRRAFASCDYKVLPDRIALEIGKGGDLLVAAILGPQAEEKDGKKLRRASEEEFLKIAKKENFSVIAGAKDLLQRLRERNFKVALATSSKVKHLDAMTASAGLDLRKLADVVVTADDIQTSKPAPDLVFSSLEKLGLSPAQCAMVGDTPYDAEACRHSGVVCLGVLSGGNPEEKLRQAGARMVWKDAADIFANLDQALAVASPGSVHWTQDRLESLMREALVTAREGKTRGEKPVGCVLAGSDGALLARGSHEVQLTKNPTAHALFVALNKITGNLDPLSRDLVVVSTVEPCVMCTGAALEIWADIIVYGCQKTPEPGVGRVSPSIRAGQPVPRVIGHVLAEECRALWNGKND